MKFSNKAQFAIWIKFVVYNLTLNPNVFFDCDSSKIKFDNLVNFSQVNKRFWANQTLTILMIENRKNSTYV